MNCFRFLGLKSFAEVDRLTIPEYELLMKAARLREVDKSYRNHLQAFLNFVVKAEQKAGKNKTKPVYTTFRKFFNYEREIEKAIGTGKSQDRFSEIQKFLKSKRKE